MKQFNRTYAEVNLDAIRHNIDEVHKNIKEGTKVMAIVKANAYGHGMIPVAEAAQAAGAAGFCVAILDEALALRRANYTEPILVLGITQPTEIE